MIANPRDLPDQQLEDVLLLGVRALGAGQGLLCAEQVPRYSATPDRRRASVHLLLECSNELMRRRAVLQLQGEVMSEPHRVADYLMTHFRGYEAEAFVVIFLDVQHRVIAVEEMFRGTVAQASVYPREVVKRALLHNASAVLLAHNHPSGVATPSRADEFLTKTLKQALGLIDVKVLDHFIVGANTTTSFATLGLI